MRIEHRALRRRQRVIFVLVDVVGEYGRVERRVDVVFDHLVDAEQIHRAPGEGDGVGDAAGEHLARFRRRGLDIRAAELLDEFADGALRRAHLQALHIRGPDDFLLGVQRAGIVDEGHAEMRVLHLLAGIGAIPCVERLRALARVAEGEGDFADGDDRKAAGLIAGIDIGHVDDAVARHVVMVEGLAELLGGIDRHLQRSPGLLGDVVGPGLRRLDQRMRRRNPERKAQIDRRVGGEGGRRGDEREAGRRRAQKGSQAAHVSSPC